MENYDDLFTQGQSQDTPRNDQPFDKEAWKQQKKEQREAIYTMIDEAAVNVARDGDAFQKYLDVQSRFDRYSVSNALLIFAQRPDATELRDFDSWKEQGAYIRKNETGIFILEPGDEYQREDGTTGVSYNTKRVFDVSQTGVIRKHEPPSFLGDRERISALVDHSPVPVHVSDTLPTGEKAIYKQDSREILVWRGLDAASIFRALSQELAHAEMDKGDGQYNRDEHDFYATCVSYILCRQFGVATDGNYHFEGASQVLSGLEPQAVRAELSTIRQTASEIACRMNRTLNQQRQQRRSEPER